MRSRFTAVVIALTILVGCGLVGCGPQRATPVGTTPEGAASSPDDAPENPCATASADPLDVAIADETRAAVEWLQASYDPASEPIDEATYEARFHPGFREQVSLAKLRPIHENDRAKGPYEVHCAVVKDAHRVAVQFRAVSGEAGFLAMVGVDPETELIRGLIVKPAMWLASTPPASWAELGERVAAQGEQTTLFAAEVKADGSLEPIAAHTPSLALPIGSAFKLWVLNRLVEDVAAGERTWADTVTLEADDRTFSSLEMDHVADGTALPIEDVAAAMIRSSDNTATDLLVDTLGRERIEETMTAIGIADPRARPLLRTRDMFWLKLQTDDETRAAFVDGDDAARRAIVARVDEEWDLGAAGWRSLGWTGPRQVAEIEWYASALELAATMVSLRSHFPKTEDTEGEVSPGAPARRILSMNTIVTPCAGFAWVGFKGGSEPGVMNLTYLAERDDGRWFVVVVGAMSESALIDEAAMTSAAWHALNLLATTP